MQFFVEFGTFILIGYLTLSNGLASVIEEKLAHWSEPSASETLTEQVPTPTFAQLASEYNQKSIPDILLNSIRFQGANTFDSLNNQDVPVANPADAMVNIYCTYTTETHVKATTGSGFFISKTGVILTNAHIAQFLLLEAADRPGETACVLRTGNPAIAMYEAELLYVPPSWIQTNASLLKVETPTGTGERDYALLLAARSIDTSPLPAAFPYLDINADSLDFDDLGKDVIVYGYPATPLLENGLSAEIRLVHASTSIDNLFTFKTSTADLLAVSNEAVSRGGVSGGPVLDSEQRVIGVNVTKGADATYSLRALTIDYINRTIKEETNLTLYQYISGDAAQRSQNFREVLAPFLTTLLEFQLREI